MDSIPLASTGRKTTRLGFGGSSIMGVLNRRQSLALLEEAYDAGIRHFDTAPSYGFGESEPCLGEFLTRHSDCTVTTKFGIAPAGNRLATRMARAVLGPLLQAVPALKGLRKTSPAGSNQVEEPTRPNPIFTPETARVSIEQSLRNLKRDRIDLLLLHEARAIDLADDKLLDVLQAFVSAGSIGALGVGSDREHIARLEVERPEFCGVLQYEWSVLNAVPLDTPGFRIHHRSLSGSFKQLLQAPERLAGWSTVVGADLGTPQRLASLMLKASLVMNPQSLVLFSSKSPAHIRQNVQVAGDETLEAPARRLYQAVQAEPPAM